MDRLLPLALALFAFGLTSCTSLFTTRIEHNLAPPHSGRVHVVRIFPVQDESMALAKEKQMFYTALAKIGLTPTDSLRTADWVLFYHYVLEDARTSGYTVNVWSDSYATISPDRLYSTVMKAELFDNPKGKARWKASGIAVTRHLGDYIGPRMIADAAENFPGQNGERRERWR